MAKYGRKDVLDFPTGSSVIPYGASSGLIFVLGPNGGIGGLRLACGWSVGSSARCCWRLKWLPGRGWWCGFRLEWIRFDCVLRLSR